MDCRGGSRAVGRDAPSPSCTLSDESIEAKGAEVEGSSVETLEIERRTEAPPGLVAGGEPRSLSHLVSDGLPWPSW